MESTTNLSLPYIMPAQAQKHVTHNEAIRALDAIVQLSAIDRALASPPDSPSEGDRYIVPAGATGAWATEEGSIAAWQDGSWAFYAPREGWIAWVAAEDALFVFDGGTWAKAASGSGSSTVSMIGINTPADPVNRLAVKSDAALFSHDDVTPGTGGMQLKVNKATAGDTASVLFQTAFSGRAEFGLAGDDDWHVKVSPDGSAWHEALVVDRTSGRIRFPSGGAREVLVANRTYHVRPDGSDSNTGLANTSGGAFATIQKALDVTFGTLDMATFNVTILVAAGTYAENLMVRTPRLGSGAVVLQGDLLNPGNVMIAGTSDCLQVTGDGLLDIRGFRLNPGTGRHGLYVNGFGTIFFRSIEFGATTGVHIQVLGGGLIQAAGSYAILGNAARHIVSSRGGMVTIVGQTVTLSNAPVFSQFAVADLGSAIMANGNTYTGDSASGARYAVSTNSVIHTNGGGANYFPGSAAGTATTGGQYV